MKTIFYDLETSQLEFCGQILNYCFITVDENWNHVSELSGKIKISRTQLPYPGAILANKTDVIKHQQEAQDSEPIAMQKIRNYLEEVISNEKDSVKLIGFNSSRFDLHYLRTSMIRNGVSPYFGKNIVYGDVLHVAQKLAVSNDTFRDLIGVGLPERPRMNLERLCKLHEILNDDDSQLHESKEDVLLTIDLAKRFQKEYGIDVRTYCPFEVKRGLSMAMKVFPDWELEYHKDPESDSSPKAMMVKLDEQGNYSLWINVSKCLYLERKHGDSIENLPLEIQKETISWYNANGSVFFTEESGGFEPKVVLACGSYKKKLSHINLSNFFPERNCDIEAFIYMMSFNENSALYEAIWMKDLTNIKRTQSKYASELYLRYLMSNGSLNENTVNLLQNYSMYRYGGKMKVNRYDVDENKPDSFHRTLKSLYGEAKDAFNCINNIQDKNLMKSLLDFYEDSSVMKLCHEELLDE